MVDIVYPLDAAAHRFPYFSMMGVFARFVIFVAARHLNTTTHILLLEAQRVQFLGMSKSLLKDGWPFAIGREWQSYAHVHGIIMVINLSDKQSQMGAAGRQVDLLATDIAHNLSYSPDMNYGAAVRHARLGRNNATILSTGLSPGQIGFGKADYF